MIPDADLGVVHRADTDQGRRVDGEAHWGLVESLLEARRTQPKPKPDLRPLRPTVLSSQLPPAIIPEYRALPESFLDSYLGDYDGEYKLTPGGTVGVFLFDGKPYLHLPGVGDVQMFATARRDILAVRVVPGMGIAFERGADDEVTAVILSLGDHTLKASRAQRQ